MVDIFAGDHFSAFRCKSLIFKKFSGTFSKYLPGRWWFWKMGKLKKWILARASNITFSFHNKPPLCSGSCDDFGANKIHLIACLKRFRSMPEACSKPSWSVLEACSKHAWSMLEACSKSAQSVLKGCSKKSWRVLEACLKRSLSVLEACLKRKHQSLLQRFSI